VLCEGEMGLQSCGIGGVRLCVCGPDGLERCGECLNV
jgi:hypothetical protein